MALSATCVFELRSGGNDLNGGGFNSAAAGTDRSQQDSPHVTIDGATITAVVHSTTTQLTITGYTVSSADVGNLVRIAGGTATAGTYQITAVDTGDNRWTLDRSAGTAAQTATGRMGGARKFLGSLFSATTTPVAGNKVWWKSDGFFSITTSTPGDGGPAVIAALTNIVVEGYHTSRGDLGTAPVLDAGAQTGVTLISGTGSTNPFTLINIAANGNSNATVTGFNIQTRAFAWLCQSGGCASGFAGAGFMQGCKATTSTVGFDSGTRAHKCEADQCGTGYLNSAAAMWTYCVARRCTGAGFESLVAGVAINCVAYGNTGDGFRGSSSNGFFLFNCISAMNSMDGYDASNGTGSLRMFNCADFNNTQGRLDGTPTHNVNPVSLSENPFNDPDNGDFSLNNTAGGGAACRGAGRDFPGMPDEAPDIGVHQHVPAIGGGLLRHPGMCGGLSA